MRRILVPCDGVLVHRYPALIQYARGDLTRHVISVLLPEALQVDQEKMGFRSSVCQFQAEFLAHLGEVFCILRHLSCIFLELAASRDQKAYRLGGYVVHMGTSLLTWENSPVQQFRLLGIGGQQYSSPGSRKGLVCGCHYDVGIFDGIVQNAADDERGYMGNVRQQQAVRAYLVGDLPEGLPVDVPRIGAVTSYDESRPVLDSELSDLSVV